MRPAQTAPTRTLEAMIATLFTAYRKRIGEADLTLYERGCGDIPLPLLDAAVAHAIRTRRFLPVVAELRADAETQRQAIAGRLPYVPCRVCRDEAPSWVEGLDGDGVRRVARCACWIAHQALCRQHGYTATPVSQPALLERGSEEPA